MSKFKRSASGKEKKTEVNQHRRRDTKTDIQKGGDTEILTDYKSRKSSVAENDA